MNIKSKFEMPKFLDSGRLDLIVEIMNTIKSSNEITLSFVKTEKVSPVGHAILFSMLDSVCEQKVKLRLKDYQKMKLSLHPELIGVSTLKQVPYGFIDIKKLKIETKNLLVYGKSSSIAPEFIQRFSEKFEPLLGEDCTWDITLIFNELLQNAVDHSTSERYFLYAGVYDNNFEFGILDLGVSIPAKLETKYSFINDEEYLKAVFKQGVGTRRNREGGMGLYYLFENIKDAKGRLVILSRNAQIRYNFGTRNYKAYPLKYKLTGTWCIGSIPLGYK